MMETPMGFYSDGTATNSYSVGWQMFRENVGLFIGIVVISILLSIPAQFVNEDSGVGYVAFANAWSFFVVTPISMSTAWVYLRKARGEDAKVMDMFAVFERNYVNVLLANIIMGIAIFIGILLLIVPGIIIALRLSFTPYFLIDERMSAMDALKTSWEATRGIAVKILVLGLIAIPVFLLGLLAFGVGVVVSTAVIASAGAVFFRTVTMQRKEKPKNDDAYAFE